MYGNIVKSLSCALFCFLLVFFSLYFLFILTALRGVSFSVVVLLYMCALTAGHVLYLCWDKFAENAGVAVLLLYLYAASYHHILCISSMNVILLSHHTYPCANVKRINDSCACNGS